MRKFEIQDIEQLISAVGLPCDDPDFLMRSLNVLIGLYEECEKKKKPRKDKIRKDAKQNLNAHDAFIEKSRNSLAHFFFLMENYENKIVESEVDQARCDASIFVISKILKILEAETQEVRELYADKISSDGNKRQRTYQSSFLYAALPNYYEKHFDRKFGVSESSVDGKVSGPGVRFIKFVADFLEIPIKESGIKKGWITHKS